MFKNLDFSPLNYKFTSKPLLVGGKAKEYCEINEPKNFKNRRGVEERADTRAI